MSIEIANRYTLLIFITIISLKVLVTSRVHMPYELPHYF